MTSFYDRGGIAAASVAALAVVLVGLALGLWQLRRADEKAALQSAQDRAAAEPARDLAGGTGAPGLAAGGSLPAPAAVDGRLVQLSGEFDSSRTIYLDNRTRTGVAGMHVLTPVKLDRSDRRVLVLRGWVARDPADRNRLPAVPTPAGTVRIAGMAVAELQQPMMLGDEPVPGPTDRLWQRFTYEKFAHWSGYAPYPVIVRQTVEPDYQDGLARDWNRPGVSVDKHLGYAFQWFALTAAAILTWLALLWRRRRSVDVR